MSWRLKRTKHLIVLAVSLAVAFVTTARADIINVPGDFPTIQEAIDAAVNGDEVVVAPGTYNERIDFLGRQITVRSSGGPKVTTIDANRRPGPAVVRCESMEPPLTTLQGFRITGGTNSGMSIVNSAPTVTDCVFSENDGFQGGGIYIQDSLPTVTDCLFIGNSAFADGGGIYQQQGVVNPTVTNCTFISNTAGNHGGGMFNWGVLTLTNCTFSKNVASGEGGGGFYNTGNNNQTVTNCVFTGNLADDPFGSGGGMRNMSNNTTVVGCTFGGNSAGNSGGGLESVSAAVDDCTFTGNIAKNGGGLSVGTGNTSVSGSTFCDNQPNDIVGPVTLSNISSCDPCPADLDGSGDVGVSDLLVLLGNWGPCP